MSAGMPRTIPAPLRAKGTSPLGTPDCRRRTVNDGAITRLQLAIDPPCHGPPALVPTPFDGSQGSPSLRLRSPAPLHSGRFGLRFSGHARYVFRATEYISCPAEAGMCEPLRSRSRRTVQQLCQLLHGPQIWKSVPASSVICALAGKLPGGPHGEVDPPLP